MSFFGILLSQTSAIAPQFQVSPNVTKYNHDGYVVQGSINKKGNIYVYHLADGSPVPSSATVKASATTSVSDTAAFQLAITGLSESTSYDCYVVAEDENGVLQSSPTKIDITTPADLDTIFGANLKLWLNTDTSSGKTLTGLESRKISSLTDNSASAFAFTDVGTYKTVWNGKTFYFKSASALQQASTSNFNFLHSGAPFTVAFEVEITQAASGDIIPIFMNNGITTARRGFGVLYNNNSPRTNALVVNITNGTAGQNNILLSIDNVIIPGQRHSVRLEYTGGSAGSGAGTATMTVYVDDVSVGSASNLNTHSTSNATDNFFVGRYSNIATYAKNLLVGNIIFIDRAVTAGERTSIETYLTHGTRSLGIGPEANLYTFEGQSNIAGAYSTGLPGYLSAPTGAMMWNRTAGTHTGAEVFAAHEYGVNNNTEDQTLFGPDLEFAYRMNLEKPDTIWLGKYAVSGSSMKLVTGGANDWNYLSAATSDCLYQAENEMMPRMLRDLQYELDRTVRYRGDNWRQGESDTTEPNAYYENDFTERCLRKKAQILAVGITMSDYTRLVCASLDNLVASRGVGCQNIVDQTQNVVDDAVTVGYIGGQQFSTLTYAMSGDGTHFSGAGQVEHGYGFYEALYPYRNE